MIKVTADISCIKPKVIYFANLKCCECLNITINNKWQTKGGEGVYLLFYNLLHQVLVQSRGSPDIHLTFIKLTLLQLSL